MELADASLQKRQPACSASASRMARAQLGQIRSVVFVNAR